MVLSLLLLCIAAPLLSCALFPHHYTTITAALLLLLLLLILLLILLLHLKRRAQSYATRNPDRGSAVGHHVNTCFAVMVGGATLYVLFWW